MRFGQPLNYKNLSLKARYRATRVIEHVDFMVCNEKQLN